MYKNEMKGLDSAAALVAVMSLWQDTPLDYGAYYTCTTTAWGCYVSGSSSVTPSYHGLKAYGDIVRYPVRTVCSCDTEKMTVLSGRDEEKNHALLIAGFSTGDMQCAITLDREIPAGKCKVFLLDENHNLSEDLQAQIQGNTIHFENKSNSFVALVKLEK